MCVYIYKRAPVSHTMAKLEGEMEELKKNFAIHEDMMNVNVDTITARLDTMYNELKRIKSSCGAELQRMEGLLSAAQSVKSTPRSQSDSCTAVFGGFKGASSKDEVDSWLSTVLSTAGAKRPSDTYIKGEMANYNGLVFGKYATSTDMDTAVKKVQEMGLKYAGQSMWAKIDQPVQVRVPEGVLFAAKKMLVEWGWGKKSIWVDKDEQCVTCGGNHVMSVSVVDRKVRVVYDDGWEDYTFSKDHPNNVFWKDTLNKANEKMSRQAAPTKGLGKGKPSE